MVFTSRDENPSRFGGRQLLHRGVHEAGQRGLGGRDPVQARVGRGGGVVQVAAGGGRRWVVGEPAAVGEGVGAAGAVQEAGAAPGGVGVVGVVVVGGGSPPV